MEEKSIDELSFEEVLEQLGLTSKQGRKYSLNKLIIKLTEKLPHKNLNETILYTKYMKVMLTNFGQIFGIDSQKAIELLKRISSKESQDRIISKFFKRIFNSDSQKAIELLNNISSKKLQDKTISERFRLIFKKDSQKAIELLNNISSKELQDKIIFENFELLNTISLKELPYKTISENFRQFFYIDSQKAIELLNSISSKELKDKTISENFGQIFEIDSKKAIELLNTISLKELQDKTISENFGRIFEIDYQKAIELLNTVSSKDLKNRIIETFFNDFMQGNRDLSIRLLSKISDSRLQEKIVVKYLLSHNLMDMELLKFCSKNIIKEKLIPLKIDELNNIQKNINRQNRSNAIYKAHREVQKEDNSTLELEELNVNRLSFLIIHEEEESNFIRLLNEFSKRVQKEEKNYSELIFKTIRDSKIQNNALLELEKYIKEKKIKNRFKKMKEDIASQKSVNEILEKMHKSRKKRDKDKEKYFLYLFRRKHDIKTIHAVIPQIAIKDFGLAKRLLNRVQDKKLKEKTQKEMFLNLHKNLEQMMYAYKRIKDFHTKERLSKIALAHHLPTFTNSFFHKSLSALDSQNIINTLDELSTFAPREVLKYYGEIEDDIEDRVNGVIEEIEELKSEREKAENLEDEELFDKVEIEAQKLKDEILEDREFIEAFITRVGITEFKFKRGVLLDLA